MSNTLDWAHLRSLKDPMEIKDLPTKAQHVEGVAYRFNDQEYAVAPKQIPWHTNLEGNYVSYFVWASGVISFRGFVLGHRGAETPEKGVEPPAALLLDSSMSDFDFASMLKCGKSGLYKDFRMCRYSGRVCLFEECKVFAFGRIEYVFSSTNMTEDWTGEKPVIITLETSEAWLRMRLK